MFLCNCCTSGVSPTNTSTIIAASQNTSTYKLGSTLKLSLSRCHLSRFRRYRWHNDSTWQQDRGHWASVESVSRSEKLRNCDEFTFVKRREYFNSGLKLSTTNYYGIVTRSRDFRRFRPELRSAAFSPALGVSGSSVSTTRGYSVTAVSPRSWLDLYQHPDREMAPRNIKLLMGKF